jgi:hypothetical protein
MRFARTWLALPVALVAALVAACAGGAPSGTSSPAPSGDAGKPQVVIQSPPANAQVLVGTAIEVVTTGVDAIGVARIDLRVNGSAVSSAEAPLGGQQSLSAVHLWAPSVPGAVQLSAIAYRTDGAPSDEYSVAVTVLAAGSSVAPYPTFDGPLPTHRASAVAPNYAQPTYKANPTYAAGATPTYAAGATPTYVAGATPTYAAEATPTYEPTPTYEATPTYSAAPTTVVAPPDGNHALVVPYNGAEEVDDYVSYPAGDVEDQVSYSVSGIGTTPPQHQAHLIVFATCEGVGTEFITFQVGTAKFRCGEKIIDKEVTADTDTGVIKVFAFGGAYVHWTLNASAFAP